jgi:phosphatidylserine decarboxylase
MVEQRWPIAREGLPFVMAAAAFTVLMIGMGWLPWAFLGLVMTLFIAYFFRNPKRDIPGFPNAILSPADGTIIAVGETMEDRFLKEKACKVSIFMSLFDVHINRVPVSGKVLERSYHPGRFLVASRDKASLANEQNAVMLETEDHLKILLIQIAGFVARRIVCYPKAGDLLKKGDIFGLIRFGSRVDLYLPTTVKLAVRVGQHVSGGTSIIGYRV